MQGWKKSYGKWLLRANTFTLATLRLHAQNWKLVVFIFTDMQISVNTQTTIRSCRVGLKLSFDKQLYLCFHTSPWLALNQDMDSADFLPLLRAVWYLIFLSLNLLFRTIIELPPFSWSRTRVDNTRVAWHFPAFLTRTVPPCSTAKHRKTWRRKGPYFAFSSTDVILRTYGMIFLFIIFRFLSYSGETGRWNLLKELESYVGARFKMATNWR